MTAIASENGRLAPVSLGPARLGAAAVLVGAAGVVATSILYGLSPPAAAMPLVPLDLGAAASGAVRGAATMHWAGTLGVFSDVLIAGGGMALGADRVLRGEGAAALGWFLIAVSTVLFAVVDSMVGFVLPPLATAGASPAFLGAKKLFDALFALGTATFGAGACLAAAGERRLPRLLALAAFGAGLAALVGGGGVILGANLTPLIGVGLLGGSSLFVLIGARLATLRFP